MSGTRAFPAVMAAEARYGGSGPSFGRWTGDPGVRARFDRHGRVRLVTAQSAAWRVARKLAAAAGLVVAGVVLVVASAALGLWLMYVAAMVLVYLR